MANVSLTVTLTEQELERLENYCQQTRRAQSDVIRDYIASIENQSKEQLLAELVSLHQELQEVKQEKADLEILLETTTEHSSTIEAELHDEAQQARRESEQRFRAIAEATPVPVLIWRLSDGEIIYANAASSTSFGFPVEKLLGRSSLELYYQPSDHQRLLDIFLREGTVQNYELRCKKADGTLFWVTVSLKSLTFKGESTLVSAFHDITDLKQAEAALQQAKEQLEAVLNAVPGLISWVDSDGRYLGVNRYLAESLNLLPEGIVGKEVGFFNRRSPFTQFIYEFLESPELSACQEIEVPGKNAVRYYLIAAQKYQQGSCAVTVGIDITERKHMEEALKQSEARNRAFLDAIPDMMFRIRRDGTYLDYKADRVSDLLVSPSEILGRTVYDVLPPDLAQQRMYYVEQALQTGKIQEFDYQLRSRSGDWRNYEARLVVSGENEVLAIVRDITDRKQAEEALRQSEATNRALVMAIPDLLIRAKGDGTYIDIVSSDRLSVQNARQFQVGTTVYDSLPLDKAQQRMRCIQQALQTGGMQVYEQEFIVNSQPQYEEVRIVAIRDDEVLIIVRDITERKRAEEALRIAEENYRSIFENALEGIFQSTSDGRYLSVNPAMARIYGYESPQEMIAMVQEITTQIYVNPNEREEFKHRLDEQGVVKDWEYRVYRKDGRIIWVEENTRAVRNSSGTLLYYEGIIEDITKRKLEEEDLKRQVQELKIEIDHQKRAREVAEITQSDYFQELQAAAERLRFDEDDF